MQKTTTSHVKKLLPRRKPTSHKGDNGRVLIIGGSKEYYGAPILNAMGALFSGADLVYLLVPKCNFEISRSYYPDFIVRSLDGDFLQKKDFGQIKKLADMTDCVVIGSGMTEHNEDIQLIGKLLESIKKPAVCDALAIEAVNKIKPASDPIVITPHAGEFERFAQKNISVNFKKRMALVEKTAITYKTTIVFKGPVTIIASPDGKIALNANGNAGLTVGGTGDVLAGLVGGLMAQGLEPFAAGQSASFILGAAGDELYKEKGYGYIASELARKIPEVLKKIGDS